MQIASKFFPVISNFHDVGNSKSAFSPCMMIPEAKSTFSFLFDSVVQYIQILWDF